MHKAIKYTVIALSTLIVTLGVVVGVAIYILFTPSRLTPIVNGQVPNYVSCPVEVVEVSPTFFSTFPNVGLRLSDVTIVNPKEGAQSDTLLHVGTLDAIINLKKFIRTNEVEVSRFILSDVQANLYIAQDSTTNYDILVSATDEPEDESESALNEMNLQGIRLNHVSVSYIDCTSGTKAQLCDLQLCLDGQNRLQEMQGEFRGLLQAASVQYADNTQEASIYGLSLSDYTLTLCTLDSLAASLKANADSIRYCQTGQNPIRAEIDGMTLPTLHATLAGGQIALEMENAIGALTLSQVPDGLLANRLPIQMSTLLKTDTLMTYLRLDTCQLSVADERAALSGDIRFPDSTTTEIEGCLRIASTSFDRLLTLVPSAYRQPMQEMTIHGDLDDVFVSAHVAMVDTVLDIRALEFETTLSDLEYSLGKEILTQIENCTMTASYPVESEKMEQLKQNQQIKRQHKTNIRRRSHAIRKARFMQASITSKSLHVMMQDSAVTEATIPTLSLKGTFSDEILRDANSLPFIAAEFEVDHLQASMDTLAVISNNLRGTAVMADGVRGLKKYYEATFSCQDLDARMGSALQASTGTLDLEASSVYDAKQRDPLLMYNPVLNIKMKEGNIHLAEIAYPILIPNMDFDFNLGRFIIRDGQFALGNSDFQVSGNVLNIQRYLKDEGLLTAQLQLKSQKTDVYQLLDIVDALNLATDSTDVAATAQLSTAGDAGSDVTASNHIPSDATIESASPFMVPQGVKVELKTSISHAICGENDFTNLGGKVTINDGDLVIEEMGFSSKAARMQMTALYRSPRKNHLYVGLDFHLLDIEIADLIHMYPEIDSIMPMLSAFDGAGEFHIAAESNLFANYDPKMSTLKAAASIEGKDLMLMDNATFSDISRYLMFNKKTENRIDTLSAEMVVAHKQATIFPMLIGMDKYQAVISGNHNLTGNMGFNYHISITDAPLVGGLIGLDITGDMKHPDAFSYKVGKCKYANLYKPARRNVTQQQTLQLKQEISTALKRNVRPQEEVSETDPEVE